MYLKLKTKSLGIVYAPPGTVFQVNTQCALAYFPGNERPFELEAELATEDRIESALNFIRMAEASTDPEMETAFMVDMTDPDDVSLVFGIEGDGEGEGDND